MLFVVSCSKHGQSSMFTRGDKSHVIGLRAGQYGWSVSSSQCRHALGFSYVYSKERVCSFVRCHGKQEHNFFTEKSVRASVNYVATI